MPEFNVYEKRVGVGNKWVGYVEADDLESARHKARKTYGVLITVHRAGYQ